MKNNDIGKQKKETPAIIVGCMRFADFDSKQMNHFIHASMELGANWKGCFLGSEEYSDLNKVLQKLAEKYQVSTTTIATAWILRHPAKMQVISGTTSEKRLREIVQACSFEISREEWYQLYLAAGHSLP